MEKIVHNYDFTAENALFCGKLDQHVLLIFAKQPLPGQVKTRLTPPLTASQAAIFYALSQADTLRSVRKLKLPIVLCYSGDRDYFRHHFPDVELCAQGDGDLGQRLQRMFAIQWQRGTQRVCVIGTDSPDLPVVWITEVFAMLAQYAVITIPAADGGYVLLGCSRTCPQLFRDISWSSNLVLKQTKHQAQHAGCSYTQLHQWQDVDDIESLRSYAVRSLTDSGLPRASSGDYARRCLRQLEKHTGMSGSA